MLPFDLRSKVLAPAINKAASKARTEMSRRIRAEYVLSAGRVNELLATTKASAAKPEAELRAKLRRGRRSLNVIEFLPASQRNLLARSRGKQLSFKIKKGAAKQIKGAFVGNQGRTVFIRTGKSRLPIKAVQTIDVGQMFNARRIRDAVVRKIGADLVIEVERAIRSGRFV